MPRVQRYGGAQVRTTPLPNARREAHETVESQGGPVGQAVAGLGEVGARVAGAVVVDMLRQERERKDALENLEIDRQFMELERNLLHDPETGFLTKRGMDPFNTRDAVLAERDKQAGLIAQGLTNDRARLHYEQRSGQQRASMAERMDVYASSEYKTYFKSETEAGLDDSVNKAIADADPASVGEQLQFQSDLIDRVGQQVLGLGPEGRDLLKTKLRSQTHVGVIHALIAQQKDGLALDYFAHFGDQITDGNARAAVEEKLDASSTDSQAFAAANDIYDRLAPTDDDSPISIDQMEAAARAQFKDDPRVYAKTVSYLRSRLEGVNAGRKARTDERDDALWTAVSQNVPLATVRAMPEFRLAPGKVKDQIVDEYRNEAARAESLAASRASRAAAVENRAYTAQLRAENQKEIDHWGEYYRQADPAVLRTLSRGDIQRQMPTIGREHVGRLLNDLEQLQKSTDAVRSVTVDADMFKDIAFDAGLTYIRKTNAAMKPAERANAGKLLATVKETIAKEQGDKSRALTFEEKQAITQAIVDQKVMVKDWYFDDPVIAALVNPDDLANAYVPFAEITDAKMLSDAAAFLKREAPTLSPDSAAYRTRVERAAGRRLAGGTKAQVEDALRGK